MLLLRLLLRRLRLLLARVGLDWLHWHRWGSVLASSSIVAGAAAADGWMLGVAVFAAVTCRDGCEGGRECVSVIVCFFPAARGASAQRMASTRVALLELEPLRGHKICNSPRERCEQSSRAPRLLLLSRAYQSPLSGARECIRLICDLETEPRRPWRQTNDTLQETVRVSLFRLLMKLISNLSTAAARSSSSSYCRRVPVETRPNHDNLDAESGGGGGATSASAGDLFCGLMAKQLVDCERATTESIDDVCCGRPPRPLASNTNQAAPALGRRTLPPERGRRSAALISSRIGSSLSSGKRRSFPSW